MKGYDPNWEVVSWPCRLCREEHLTSELWAGVCVNCRMQCTQKVESAARRRSERPRVANYGRNPRYWQEAEVTRLEAILREGGMTLQQAAEALPSRTEEAILAKVRELFPCGTFRLRPARRDRLNVKQQRDILQLSRKGLTPKAIADQLGLSSLQVSSWLGDVRRQQRRRSG